MPLTQKGEEILGNMKKQYGDKKGEEVFYASANKGTITGVHDKYSRADFAKHLAYAMRHHPVLRYAMEKHWLGNAEAEEEGGAEHLED